MTIHFFFWNFFSLHYLRTLEAGYSKEWGFLSYDLKKKIVEYYKENHEKINNDNHFHRKFNQRYMNYTKDVYTSFFWQQAPQSLVVWVSRRNTAFHTSMATFTGIVLGVLGSAVLAWYSQMHFSNGTYILIASVLIFLFMLYANARNARNEGWQEIDVWLSQIFNPAAKMAVEQISNKTTHSQEGE